MINEIPVVSEQHLLINELNSLLFAMNMPDSFDMNSERNELKDILRTLKDRPSHNVQTYIQSTIALAKDKIKAQYEACLNAYRDSIQDSINSDNDELSPQSMLEYISKCNIVAQKEERSRREQNSSEVRLEDSVVHLDNRELTNKRDAHLFQLNNNYDLRKKREQIISQLKNKPDLPVMLDLIIEHDKIHQLIESSRSELEIAYLREVRTFCVIGYEINRLLNESTKFSLIYSQHRFDDTNKSTSAMIEQNAENLSKKSFSELDDAINTIHQAIMKYNDIVEEFKQQQKRDHLAFTYSRVGVAKQDSFFNQPKPNRLPSRVTPSLQENNSSNIVPECLLVLGGAMLIAASLALFVALSPLQICCASLGIVCLIAGIYSVYDSLVLTESEPSRRLSLM